MAVTTLSIQTTINNVLGQIQINDTTDYVGQGVVLDGSFAIAGRLAVYLTSASGTQTLYDNLLGVTPDIDPNIGPGNQNVINVARDINGNVLNGTYTVVYQVDITPPTDPQYRVSATTVYDYDQELPKICLTAVVNCVAALVTSYDETNYGPYATSVSRQHTLYPPPASPMAPITGTQQTLIAGPNIYDTTWTQEVIATITFTMPSGLIVIVEKAGSREFKVVCDVALSQIACCLDKLMKKYEALRCKNPVRAQDMYDTIIAPTLRAMTVYEAMIGAGKTDEAAYWYQQIITNSGCDESCGCNSPGPNQIYPVLTSNNSFVVDSPDNSIKVVPEVIGNTTYYHIQVSTAIQNIINNFRNVTITTNTPAALQIVQTGTGSNINYELNVIGSGAGTVLSEQNTLIIIDGTTDGTNYLAWEVHDKGRTGNNIQPFTSQIYVVGQTLPNQATDLAIINVLSVPVTPANRFMVWTQINKSNLSLIPTNLKNIECECLFVDFATGNITLRLYNPQNGNTYTLADLRSGGFDLINIAIKILA